MKRRFAMRKAYFNVICEEISILGGKIIHVDENLESMDEVHKLVLENNYIIWRLYIRII